MPAEAQEEGIDECVRAAAVEGDLKEVVAVLAGGDGGTLRRHTTADIFSETCIPPERIVRCLSLLQEKGAVREQSVFGSSFYALTSRRVRERFIQGINLEAFREKRKARQILKDAEGGGRFLNAEALGVIEGLRDRMAFTRKEMGLIVASAVGLGRDCADFIDKAERESQGFDGGSLLALLSDENGVVRKGRSVRSSGRMTEALSTRFSHTCGRKGTHGSGPFLSTVSWPSTRGN